MKLPFYNREQELKQLKTLIQDPLPKLGVVYGRRRVGKSRLLKEVLNDNTLYYLADQQTGRLQMQTLANMLESYFPGFQGPTYENWSVFFNTFNARIDKKFVLILDEFPYLVQSSPDLPSILQKRIEQENNRIQFLLCGSSQRLMQGYVLERNAPLYGRAHLIQKLEPLPVTFLEEVTTSVQGAIEVYSIFGGAPWYWEFFKDYPNWQEAVQSLILDKNGLLHLEPQRLLQDDFRTSIQPQSLLSTVAEGPSRLSIISTRIGQKATNLSGPLANLIELGYLKKETPFGAPENNLKKTLYTLRDPFLLFWFRFVAKQMSFLEIGQVDPVFQKIQNQFLAHVGHIWEALIRQNLPFLSIGQKSWNPGKRWWGNLYGKSVEIDVISEAQEGGTILLGEIKWENRSNLKAIRDKLNWFAQSAPFLQGRDVRLVVFLKQIPPSYKRESLVSDLTVVPVKDILSSLKAPL